MMMVMMMKKKKNIHREDESFDLLDLSCLKTSCGVAENRQVRFTWPGQQSISYAVLKLYYFYVPEEYLAGLRGNGGLSSSKQGIIGQTFVPPQREFWAPESAPSNSSESG